MFLKIADNFKKTREAIKMLNAPNPQRESLSKEIQPVRDWCMKTSTSVDMGNKGRDNPLGTQV